MLEKVDLTKKLDKEAYKEMIGPLVEKLGTLQRLAKDLKIPIIAVFEGWDAAGKGTIVNEMIQALDPRGFVVFTTNEPSVEESLRPYLWNFWIRIARRGRIVIFDRSYYNRMLSSAAAKHPGGDEFQETCADISSFERQLTDNGTLIIKLFLHISKAEQKNRLEKLEADKATSWRVTKQDWKNHQKYDKSQAAIEEMLQQTDTNYAPWTIVEAHDRKFAVAKVLTTVIQAMEKQIDEKQLSLPSVEQKPLPIATAEPPVVGQDLLKIFTSSVLTDLDLSKNLGEEEYHIKLKDYQQQIRELGYLCYSQRLPVIVVFEGWDAAGKGGCIRRLSENLDHRGYTVIPVGAPSDEEKEYHYLWRFWKNVPKAGHIAIFDRSWYGRVLVERVEGFCREDEWRRAYKEINEMEEQWHRFGAVVVKFWLQIDKEEQQCRFEARLANPEKQWKITGEDWRNREKWDQYETAVDEMFFRTSTRHAPWTIVEANSKNYARIKVLETVINAINQKIK